MLFEASDGDAVASLRERMTELEEGRKERDRTIRLQQQRLNDMKKTLQRELRANVSSVGFLPGCVGVGCPEK